MERVEIKTALTLADWQAYQSHWAERVLGGQRNRLVGGLLGAGFVVAFLLLGQYLGRPLSIPSLLAGMLFVIAVSFYSARRVRQASRPQPDSYMLGPSSIVLSASGIDVAKDHAFARYEWSLVKNVEWTPHYLYVWLDRLVAIIVPLRDLPADLDVAQLREEIRMWSAQEPPAELREAAQSGQEIKPRESNSLKRFARAYGALLLGRTPNADDLTLPSRLVLPVPAAGIALWLIADRWRAGADATFFPYAVFVWSWYAVALLTAVWAAARLAQPPVSFERVLVLTTAFVPVGLLLTLAQGQWVRADWVFTTSLAIAIYAAIYVSRTLRSLAGGRQARAAFAFAAILCAATWATHTMYFSGHFWYADSEADEEDSDYWTEMAQSEALMYAQPRRIDAAVSALQRANELPAVAFFIGFAGMGEQSVFASEIALARKVFAEKFGSAQRSVLLVNDRRDLQTLPLANPTALRYTLQGVAARMRLDSDVLFLSISSHGSSEGEIAVSNGALSLNDLSADDLAAALRESGIKWRVIVVSACYAGKFIEPLRDDNTIIIAAAAADRTSFGCSDDRDLTYFGEAFYRDALPKAADLQTAFRMAAADIAARERAEGKAASNPQAHFGPALVDHLRSILPAT